MSITFVGFTVTPQGHLIDPATQHVLENAIMTPQLYEGLKHNRVNFQDNYRNWVKAVMIEKISTVMGVEFPYDPDESYVLTVDNLIKVLAIQMRFRYLILSMCDVTAWLSSTCLIGVVFLWWSWERQVVARLDWFVTCVTLPGREWKEQTCWSWRYSILVMLCSFIAKCICHGRLAFIIILFHDDKYNKLFDILN